MADQLLFVCHANLCRSPLAEFTARRLLDERPDDAAWITVGSAGTDAVDGRPMHPDAARLVAEEGVNPAPFRSRRLRATHLATATLVLTATRRQRAVCVALDPDVLHRTFTLHQFSRLAGVADPPAIGSLRAAVEAVTRARGRLQPAAPGADDLVDPMGGGTAEFSRCAEVIEKALVPIVTLIGAAG